MIYHSPPSPPSGQRMCEMRFFDWRPYTPSHPSHWHCIIDRLKWTKIFRSTFVNYMCELCCFDWRLYPCHWHCIIDRLKWTKTSWSTLNDKWSKTRWKNSTAYAVYILHQACDTNICNTLLLFIYCLFESIASESSIHQFNSLLFKDPHIPYMNLIYYNRCVYFTQEVKHKHISVC